MKVELIAYTPSASGVCCDAAAVCTASENGYRSLQHSLASGHESVLEHTVFTFRVEGISRVTLAQLTRHRLASFSVQSQRYVKMENPELVTPDSIRNSAFIAEAESTMRYVMNLYQRMVEAGIPAEDARYVTPQATTTNLIMTMNARELRHFFSLRCCKRAQWEIRKLADEMLKICKREAPILFDSAGPGCVTAYCSESRPCGHPRSKTDWEA
ncbi:MAG TPA: FAD-dependent thymidylate synthase [Spirochaetales bacterium]|nr:FAD-dependent thymidylate synthase [Spirochaetales bacterium]